MKCLLKHKNCISQAIARAKGNNFICSGITSKPCIKGDIVRLCVRGRHCQTKLEMTIKEAIGIATTITATAYNLIK